MLNVTRALGGDARVRRARCVPYAFRVRLKGKGSGNPKSGGGGGGGGGGAAAAAPLFCDCDDGGEAGMGKRLLGLLEAMGATDVFIMVTRQQQQQQRDGGGRPRRGGRRADHFLHCARELLEQCGYGQRRAPLRAKEKGGSSSDWVGDESDTQGGGSGDGGAASPDWL